MFVVSVVCYQRSLRRADHLSRGDLPTVVHRVVSRNPVNEVALAPWALSREQNCLCFSNLRVQCIKVKYILNYFYTYIIDFVLHFFLLKCLCWMVTLF